MFDSGSISSLLQQSTQPDQPSRQHERVPSKERTQLAPIELSSRTFTAFWVLLVVLHASHAAFLISCGRLYWYLEHPYLAYYADLIAPPGDRHFRFFGTVLGVFGGWNAIECLLLLLASIRARKPALPPAGILGNLTGKNSIHPLSQADPGDDPTHGTLVRLVEQGFDLFSIESKRFDTIFTIREIVVTASQVVQCYSYSFRIARPWINHILVALFVTNCVSVALLHRWLDQFMMRASMRVTSFSSPSWRASRAFDRLLCHVLDCLLTFAMSVVLPVIVFYPYIFSLDTETFTFPDSLIYSYTAFPCMIRENQALFARTLLDAGMKLVPHVGIYFCLTAMASGLRTRRELHRLAPVPSASLMVRPTGIQQPCGTPIANLRSRSPTAEQKPSLRQIRSQLHMGENVLASLKRRLVPTFFLSTALVVLSLHLQAALSNSAGSFTSASLSSKSSSSDSTTVNMCALAIYPWLSSGDSCAVIKYNCYRLGVTSPSDDAFDSVDPSTVSTVIFTHCSQLVVPRSIQAFHNLLGLEIYNSTIVEWSIEAALTNNHHPDMVFLVLVRVNMTELPPGILHTPFPDKLGDIEISMTNLSAVPASLSHVWANVGVLYIEHSHFTEVPHAVLAIPTLSELSMIGNQIVTLPHNFSDLMEAGGRYLLALGSNPLSSLSTRVKSGITFAYLSLENTAITRLPEWVVERVEEQVFAFGSPLCGSASVTASVSASSASGSGEYLSRSNPMVVAACTSRDESADGYYPLTLTDLMRPL
jgi:hypothetical protein